MLNKFADKLLIAHDVRKGTYQDGINTITKVNNPILLNRKIFL